MPAHRFLYLRKFLQKCRSVAAIAAISLGTSGCAGIASLENYVKNLLQDEAPPRTSEVNPQPPQYASAVNPADPAPPQDFAPVNAARPDAPQPSHAQQADSFGDLPAAPARPAPTPPATPAAATAPAPAARAPLIDFGGKPTDGWALAQVFAPKQSGFALIASAQASEPTVGCADDTPPRSDAGQHPGESTAKSAATRDYLPGMNGRAWAGLANGHLVVVSPVAVLRDGAVVAQAPKVYISRDYARNQSNQGKASHVLTSVARAWEGEDAILYRVFIDQPDTQPIHCLDVVLPKDGNRSLGAHLVYLRGAQPWAATLTLQRN